jgi:hypothetical protein
MDWIELNYAGSQELKVLINLDSIAYIIQSDYTHTTVHLKGSCSINVSGDYNEIRELILKNIKGEIIKLNNKKLEI